MNYRILSQDCRADNNSWHTGLNNNDLIVGPSGAGKTRGYVLPNILQCNESVIVADTKNSLKSETEAVLRQNGYKVFSLDLTGIGPSGGYNPLDYIRVEPQTNLCNEQDIMALSASLIPIESPRDPFWELSARVYLESLIGYVLECLPEDEHTMDTVIRLSREIGTGRLEKLMDGHAAAMTIINNCDHCLYLGGQDVETARYMGVKANRSVGTMLSMPLDSAWLFTRGEQPRLTKKFDLYSHQRCHERRDYEKAKEREATA